MAAAWKAAWATFLVMFYMPSSYATVLQHNKSEGVITPGLSSYNFVDELGATKNAPSNWSVDGNMITQTSNIYGGGGQCASGQNGTLFYANATATDYTWSADISTVDDDTVGIVFRYVDPFNFYKYVATNDDHRNDTDPGYPGCRLLIKIKGGSREILWMVDQGNYTPYVESYDSPNNFTVQAQGCRFIVSYNGVTDFDGTDNDCVASGGVGMYTYGAAGTHFENMRLSTLDSGNDAGANPGQVSGTGDPHLQNMRGERFDLLRTGKFLLINIPRGKPVEDALLVVQADAVRRGGGCADIYFVALNITGAWADKVQQGGLRFDAYTARNEKPKWAKFGTVELKVTHGHTVQGARYLNVYVKHLRRAGFTVGGLLGEDDHSDAVVPTEDCLKILTLSRDVGKGLPRLGSVAEAV